MPILISSKLFPAPSNFSFDQFAQLLWQIPCNCRPALIMKIPGSGNLKIDSKKPCNIIQSCARILPANFINPSVLAESPGPGPGPGTKIGAGTGQAQGPDGPMGPIGPGPSRVRSPHQFWALARGPPAQPEGLLHLSEGLLHNF